ncbi:hypothetical protein [Paenibacillus tarimensis]|uniref:hypothetical protein n=1 Tax=Paenibacillus tarimensis TaxID=416012 RepID=UPI001F1AE385|nr:hypothetical protein [Paenibacillus tarimensis]MCF2945334.1 hypothetical protein [Paenibacillus tarimensis]
MTEIIDRRLSLQLDSGNRFFYVRNPIDAFPVSIREGGMGLMGNLRSRKSIIVMLLSILAVCGLVYLWNVLFVTTAEYYKDEDRPLNSRGERLAAVMELDLNTLDEIAWIHGVFNDRLGYGRWVKFTGKDRAPYWEEIKSTGLLNPEKYDQLAQRLADLKGAETDMARLRELALIADGKQDVDALKYMHRIVHDLDYWVCADEGREDFWGATESFNSGEQYKNGVRQIARYIEENARN